MTIKPMIDLGLRPTAKLNGYKWSPAFYAIYAGPDENEWYWPNITFDTFKEAEQRAKESLADAQFKANDIIAQWNIFPTE